MRSLLLLIFIYTTNISFAQKETSNWYFGYYCGLNFQTGYPLPGNDGAFKTVDGSAVISDKSTGDLLFYTDGRNFWNRNHEQMQNAHSLPYNCFTKITQPAIIIPSAENASLFHVFCIRAAHEIPPPNDPNNCPYTVDKTKIPEGESGLNLYYYLIDMRLDNGMGNVVEEKSNILLQTNVTQKLTAIPHTNGEGHWIITHGWRSNTFYGYHWTDEQIAEVVNTDIGSVHGNYGGIYFEDELRGELKASPNGKKIACAVFSDYRPFDFFDFDASTGRLSNYVSLGNIRGQYGVSFSPDNSRLYVSSDSRDETFGRLDIILQYDLQAGDISDIVDSRMSVILGNPRTNLAGNGIIAGWSTAAKGMALAPDGRLYISGNEPGDDAEENHILVIIEEPNARGFDCDINYGRFDFGAGRTGIGFPNFMQSYFNGLKPISECEKGSSLAIYPNPTSGSMNISLPEGCSVQYSMRGFNTLGQEVFFRSAVSTGDTLDLEHLADGVYFLRFSTQNSEVVKRIVKASGAN